MPVILAAGCSFDIDAIVFDKDGTLLDFNHLWGPRIVRWIESLAKSTGKPGLAGAIYRAIGYDAARATFVPDGPMAVAAMNDIYALAAGVLFQSGYPWHEGRPLVISAAASTLAAPPTAAEIQPRGDVAGALRRLHACGVQIAIATNDERALTEPMLEQLDIAREVAAMVCGDDPLPPKPDPAGLRWLAAKLGTTPARLAMVGDSGNDMLAGRNAGVAACIGVLDGAGARPTLAQLAHVLVAGVGEIAVAG